MKMKIVEETRGGGERDHGFVAGLAGLGWTFSSRFYTYPFLL